MTPASLGGNAARWRVAHVLPSACVLDLVSSPGPSMSSHLAHPLARAAFSDLASHSPLPAAVAGADASAEAGKRAAGASWLAVFRGSDPAAGGAAGHGITHTTASMPYAWPDASCDAFPWNSRRCAQVSSLHDHRRMRPQHARLDTFAISDWELYADPSDRTGLHADSGATEGRGGREGAYWLENSRREPAGGSNLRRTAPAQIPFARTRVGLTRHLRPFFSSCAPVCDHAHFVLDAQTR